MQLVVPIGDSRAPGLAAVYGRDAEISISGMVVVWQGSQGFRDIRWIQERLGPLTFEEVSTSPASPPFPGAR